MDRESHRAAVEAGYASLAEYIEKWGEKKMTLVEELRNENFDITIRAADEIDRLQCRLEAALNTIVQQDHEIERLRAALDKTARYSKWVLQSSSFQGYNLDGGEAQDMAEMWGLIVPHKATEENREQWERYDAIELGDTFYEFADWLKSSALQQKDSE